MKYLTHLSLLASLLLSVTAATAATEKTDVFVSGQDGYHTYRIPAVIKAANGSLLAFAEGRKSAGGDSGNIDILLKRSADGGRTWSTAQVVWDDEDNTCGNPCPVLDETTGTLWLLLTHNLGTDHEKQIAPRTAKAPRPVWVAHSKDPGPPGPTPPTRARSAARGEARPAYQRAFDAQLAVNTGKSPPG